MMKAAGMLLWDYNELSPIKMLSIHLQHLPSLTIQVNEGFCDLVQCLCKHSEDHGESQTCILYSWTSSIFGA